MAEGKHLGAESGVGAGADQHEVDDEEDQLVGEAEKHGGGTRPAAPTISDRPPPVPAQRFTASRSRSGLTEPTLRGGMVAADASAIHMAHRAGARARASFWGTPAFWVDGIHASLDQVLWVLNGYRLAYAVLLITSGRLADFDGPRTLFVAGLIVLTGASAFRGLAQDPTMLIAGRAAQGVGAAVPTRKPWPPCSATSDHLHVSQHRRRQKFRHQSRHQSRLPVPFWRRFKLRNGSEEGLEPTTLRLTALPAWFPMVPHCSLPSLLEFAPRPPIPDRPHRSLLRRGIPPSFRHHSTSRDISQSRDPLFPADVRAAAG